MVSTISNKPQLEDILLSEKYKKVEQMLQVDNKIYSYRPISDLIRELSQKYNTSVLNKFLKNCLNIKDNVQLMEYLSIINMLILRLNLGRITEREGYSILLDRPGETIKKYFHEIKESAIIRTKEQKKFIQERETLYV